MGKPMNRDFADVQKISGSSPSPPANPPADDEAPAVPAVGESAEAGLAGPDQAPPPPPVDESSKGEIGAPASTSDEPHETVRPSELDVVPDSAAMGDAETPGAPDEGAQRDLFQQEQETPDAARASDAAPVVEISTDGSPTAGDDYATRAPDQQRAPSAWQEWAAEHDANRHVRGLPSVEKGLDVDDAAETKRRAAPPPGFKYVELRSPPPLPPAAPKPAVAPQAPVVSAKKILEWWKNIWAHVRTFIQRVQRRIAPLQVVNVFWFLVGTSVLIVGALLLISEYRPSGPPMLHVSPVAKDSVTPQATASSASSDTCPLKNAGDKKVIEARSDLLIKCLKRFADKRPPVPSLLTPEHYCEGSKAAHYPLGFTVNCEGADAGIDDIFGCSNVVGCTLEKE